MVHRLEGARGGRGHAVASCGRTDVAGGRGMAASWTDCDRRESSAARKRQTSRGLISLAAEQLCSHLSENLLDPPALKVERSVVSFHLAARFTE